MKFLLLGLLLLAACSAAPRDPEESREPAKRPPPPASKVPPERAIPSVPTLDDVLRLAVDTPSLRAARAAVSRDRGLVRQADLTPNPEATLKAERIAFDDLGDGPTRYKAMLSQRIETAGKRATRTEVAMGRIAESEAAYRAEELRVTVEAARLHQSALFSGLRVAARREALLAHTEKLAVFEVQAEAGRITRHEIHPLRMRLGELRIALTREQERGRIALRKLEGVLAAPAGTFTGVALEPHALPDLPDANAEETRALLHDTHPDLAALRATEDRARSQAEHARNRAWPDVTVGIEFETGENMMGEYEEAFGVSVAWPLPVFDRNQDAVAAAESEVRRIRESLADATADLVARYAVAVESVASRTEIVAEYRNTVIPALEQHLAAATAAFEAGRTDRVPVLDARIGLAEAVEAMAGIEGEQAESTIEALGLLGRLPDRAGNGRACLSPRSRF